MKKNERLNVRLTSETKEIMKTQAEKRNLSVSKYLTLLVENDVTGKFDHETHVTSLLPYNAIYNLLTRYPHLPTKFYDDLQEILNENINN